MIRHRLQVHAKKVSSPASLSVGEVASAASKSVRSVRVGDLPAAVNEKMLRAAFCGCGQARRHLHAFGCIFLAYLELLASACIRSLAADVLVWPSKH